MIHNVVQFGNILCMSFESFGELHFRPTFDTGAVRRCIAIVRAIQADCLARSFAVFSQGTSQLVTQSTRHTVKWCAELTVVSDGIVTS